MKKTYVLLAVILFVAPVTAFAQDLSFGLKSGMNVAGFGGSRIVKSDARAGFTGGGFVTIPIRSAVAIQPEVVFSRKGAHSAAYDYDAFPADGDAPPVGVYLGQRTRHDYLEFPVLVKLNASSPDDLVRTIFFVGPSVGFLLDTGKAYDIDYSEYLNSTDFAVVVGGGVEYGQLSLDARYNLGLAAIDKDYDASFGNVPGDVKNRGFAITAGFRLF